jgi:hypothetical protein
VVEVFNRMRGLDDVAVVAGVLVAVCDVRIVAVHAYLGLVRAEGFVLFRSLPVGVAASGRYPLAPVLAEVAIQADVPGWNCGLRRIMAHTAGIAGGAVGQSVKVRGGLVKPSTCVRHLDEVMAVVAERFIPEPVVDLVAGHADDLLR